MTEIQEGMDIARFDELLYAFFREARQQRIPFESILAKVRTGYPPAPEEPGFWRPWMAWPMPMVFASLLAALAWTDLPMFVRPASSHDAASQNALFHMDTSSAAIHLLIRGGKAPSLKVVLKRKGVRRFTTSGEFFYRGDRLRLLIASKKAAYAYIVHRDAKGVISPLYPSDPQSASISCRKGKQQALPGSLLVTDPGNGNEEILACFSRRPLRFGSVKRHLARKPQGSSFSQDVCAVVRRFTLARTKATP